MKNRYYPFIYDVIDDTGTNTFFPNTGSTQLIDHDVKAYKLNDTNSNMIIDLTDLTDSGNMIEGFTTEFWFKQISQTGVITKFMGLGYWDGSATDHASLHVLSNGIQLNCGQPIEATSNNLKMFDWMYIAVWRQDTTWYLLVSQNGISYLSPAMVSGFDVKGIKELQLVANPTQGVQYYIRAVSYTHLTLPTNREV